MNTCFGRIQLASPDSATPSVAVNSLDLPVPPHFSALLPAASAQSRAVTGNLSVRHETSFE